MSVADDIPVRRMDFSFPDDMDLVFIEGDPALSYFFVGAWMMLPYLEPFLIRTMQSAMEKVDDPKLKEEVKRFCAQEGQHFRQHAKANEVVKRIHPSGPRLAELEREVEAEFAAWSAEKPLKFNLAYGEGFESMTCAAARAQIEIDMFGYMKEPIRGLMYWHIMEEIEHRTVCFDVYDRLVGDWVYRTRMSLWFQRHYYGWCQKFAAAMIAADPEMIARYQTPEWAQVRKARMARYQRAYLPRLLATFMPWYNPARVKLPGQFQLARETYTALAVSVQ
ncbi:MAG: metal-dependent hydrolase [Phenylobacterium sp.]|jgi:predicted metal-dependent hydrolase